MGSAAGAVIDSWTGLRGLRMVSAALTLQGDGHGDHRHGEGSGQDPNDDVAGIAGRRKFPSPNHKIRSGSLSCSGIAAVC